MAQRKVDLDAFAAAGLLGLLLGAPGCTADGETVDGEWAAEGLALEQAFDEQGLGPVLLAGEPFSRVGLRWDGERGDGVWAVRAAAERGAWGDWVEVRPGWNEGRLYIGHADVDPGSRLFQLRLQGPEDLADFLVAEPLEPLREGDGGQQSVPGGGTGVLRQALAPANVVHSRQEWGARATGCSDRHQPARATVHHTVTPTNDASTPEQRLRSIQAYHIDTQGWCDIGYHFLVSRDGRLWQGRDELLVGAHVANHNTGNAGISFMGTYTTDRATDEQLRAAGRLVAWLIDQYGISGDILGHRDWAQTECPGDALYAQLPQIEEYARNGGVDPGATGTYRGVVFVAPDPANRIAGARVEVVGTDRSAVAREDGYFSFELPPGTYRVAAQAEGFVRAEVERQVVAGQEVWGSIGLTRVEEPPPDRVPPVLTFVRPAAGEHFPVAEIEVVLTTDDPLVERIDLAGQQLVRGAGDSFRTIVQLLPGENLLEATAADPAGNVGRASLSVWYDEPEDPEPEGEGEVEPEGEGEVEPEGEGEGEGEDPVDPEGAVEPDPVPPQVIILQPRNGAVLDQPTVWLMGQVDDPTVESVRVNHGARLPLEAGRFQAQLELIAGENYIEVEATAASGLTGQASVTVVYRPAGQPDAGLPGADAGEGEGEADAGLPGFEPQAEETAQGVACSAAKGGASFPVLLAFLLLLPLLRLRAWEVPAVECGGRPGTGAERGAA